MRKLTTPGSALAEREQEDTAKSPMSRREAKEIEEAKEAKEVKEVKDESPRVVPLLYEFSFPLLPSLPPPWLLPLLTCIAHLAQYDRLPRSGRAGDIRRPFVQRLAREHGKGKRLFRVSRHAKFPCLAHTNSV
jgi:hypothetical protein